MATHDNSADSAEETEVSEQRKRFTIPPQDESVQRWVSEQINLSTSLRLAIREWIERHGYGDATCLPVAQLPPRGRPPRRLTEDSEESDDRADSADSAEEPAPESDGSDGADDQQAGEPESEPSTGTDADESADDSTGAGSDEPVDMDAIFAANRG